MIGILMRLRRLKWICIYINEFDFFVWMCIVCLKFCRWDKYFVICLLWMNIMVLLDMKMDLRFFINGELVFMFCIFCNNLINGFEKWLFVMI